MFQFHQDGITPCPTKENTGHVYLPRYIEKENCIINFPFLNDKQRAKVFHTVSIHCKSKLYLKSPKLIDQEMFTALELMRYQIKEMIKKVRGENHVKRRANTGGEIM